MCNSPYGDSPSSIPLDSCLEFLINKFTSANSGGSYSFSDFHFVQRGDADFYDMFYTMSKNDWSTSKKSGTASNPQVLTSSSCPPDSFPNYLYDVDTDGDGQIDKCYEPLELDNASNCKNQAGSMLPALTNISNSVCKTDPATGASCGYSRSDGDNSYQLDLEMNCFGDDKEVPDYDDEPMPEPDTCAKMNDQLMVCKSNPDEKCDFYGRCEKDCGYVNGQFYCFESCSGAQCDEEIPPEVDCVNNPSDPSCPTVEPEVPENCTKSGAGLLCKENPEDKCDADGVCQKGCGEVNGVFVCYQSPSEGSDLLDIDLQPVVDELKALNKKLDFETVKNRFSLDDLGSFGTIFGES
ncbi:hypothetical protein, partial [Shewanella colwelliana]|uniref:hypothetical protein n=1 Tax=Shewanella colwelliana TaxID=23 RepID=UPI001C7DBA8E